MTKFDTLAQNAIVAKNEAATSRDSSASARQQLTAYVTLIRLFGSVQDNAEVTRGFGKDGNYKDVKSYGTAANVVRNWYDEGHMIDVIQGEKKVTYEPLTSDCPVNSNTVTKDDLKQFYLDWIVNDGDYPESMFTLSSVATAIKKQLDTEKVAAEPSQEEQAIDAFLTKEQITVKEWNALVKDSPHLKNEAIEQGLVILQEQEEQAIAENMNLVVDEIEHKIRNLAKFDSERVKMLMRDLGYQPIKKAAKKKKAA